MAVIDCVRRFDFWMIPNAQKCSTALTPFDVTLQVSDWSVFGQKPTPESSQNVCWRDDSDHILPSPKTISYPVFTESLFWFENYLDEEHRVYKHMTLKTDISETKQNNLEKLEVKLLGRHLSLIINRFALKNISEPREHSFLTFKYFLWSLASQLGLSFVDVCLTILRKILSR